MSFNVGDKFIIEVEYTSPIKDEHLNGNRYKIKNIVRQFRDSELDSLEKYNEGKEQVAYEKGLNDMLKLVRKIYGENENDGFVADELKRIFGTIYFGEIIKEYSANDIVQKIENYEKAQLEINVGDEVEGKGYWLQGVVTFMK